MFFFFSFMKGCHYGKRREEIVHGKNVKIIRKLRVFSEQERSVQDKMTEGYMLCQVSGEEKVKRLCSLLRIYSSISRKGKG